MDKFFSFLGKTVLIIVVSGGLVLGGMYFDKKFVHKTSTPTPSPSPEMITISPTTSPTSVMTPAVKTTTFSSGGVLVFKPYTLDIVPGWNATMTTHTTTSDEVDITKGGYSISIFQAAFGGGVCLYPGDPAFDGPSQQFTSFVGITGVAEQFRRGPGMSPTPTILHFTVCEKRQDNFSDLTEFGRIQYTTPLNPDAATLLQMDHIVASMREK